MHLMEGTVSDGDPTPDEIEGLAWWRGLSDTARGYWLEVARGTVANPSPADAWAASKRVADRAGGPIPQSLRPGVRWPKRRASEP
jgi:hypothetical protein